MVAANRDFNVNQAYFEWLCDMVHANDREKSWMILMKDLHSKKFYSIVAHDENRAFDGLELREDFYKEIWYPKYDVLKGECSVLEMMIGLARRIGYETMDPYNDGEDKTSVWFWEMIDNLGLSVYDDEHYAENYGSYFVEEILDDFVERRYKRNGKGGLFPLMKSRKDQRRIEIWYQMSAYLNEREAV